MSTAASWRIGGALGICYVVLVLINIFGLSGGMPDLSTPAPQLASTIARGRNGAMLGAFLDAVGSFLLIGFVFVLAIRSEPAWGMLSVLALSAAILATAGDLAWATGVATAAELARVHASPDAVKAAVAIDQEALWTIGIPSAFTYGLVGALILRSRTLPLIFGWVGLAIWVIVIVASPVSIFASGAQIAAFAGYLLSLLWTLTAGAFMLWRA
jgi:hypothetical protein